MTASRANIERFMSLPRVAVVGVSRKQGQYSRIVFEELRKAMTDVEPVNPATTEIGGVPCAASVSALQPPPTASFCSCTPVPFSRLPANASAPASR